MRVSAGAVLVLVGLILPGPLAGQGREAEGHPLFFVTGSGGLSIREGQATLRFAEDLRELGGRITLYLPRAVLPWIQVDRFTRPDLFCPGGAECYPEGTLLRAGFTLPVTEDDLAPGVHPRLVAGIGAAFTEGHTGFSYLLGVGVAWPLHPRLAPTAEVRWERLPGLRNIVMLNAGLRVGIL